ncbi:preprotein translocase subunit YajC [Spinactinospora alkalitolerans]|uniref:Preprotein translocase subunit YajC n=1 Tax=Spinactinospora alkalitolerans TaxID=687207 RepID=A0A852TXE8_9ACTN|nr:preprotein translocase subunit YajC [Spinactinospora alkalitolerans]NYE46530.1 preprotein translocase subunit YajC [Spinactinospora alkalitolerans]
MQGLFTFAAEAQETPGLLQTILPFVLIIVVFYLLFWRPQQKRRQQESRMQNTLTPGVEVMTKAGIYGTVVEVRDNDVELEISPGTRIRMVKAGIGEVVTPQEPDDDTPVEDRPDFPANGSDDDKDNPRS